MKCPHCTRSIDSDPTIFYISVKGKSKWGPVVQAFQSNDCLKKHIGKGRKVFKIDLSEMTISQEHGFERFTKQN